MEECYRCSFNNQTVICLHCSIFSKSKEQNLFIEKFDNVEKPEPPYYKELKILIISKYNSLYGDDRVCECGHPYHRHFDGYDNNAPVGCKYCQCFEFKEE
jgi:hypothetical protein